MSVTTPPSVDTLPAAPDPGNRATYNTLAYPWSAALPTFSTQLQALANNVFGNATDAASSASSAAAQASLATTQANNAAATTGATAWVNGNTYALNVCAISQIDFQTYRKKTASSVTTIDPKNDGTNWVAIGVTPPGSGGSAVTGNTTLTASSPGAITATPTAYGQYVTLPDATTCTKADNLFAVYNAGKYPIGIKDSTGTKLGWVPPREMATVALSDNSTAAGVWGRSGLDPLAVTGVSSANSTVFSVGAAIPNTAGDYVPQFICELSATARAIFVKVSTSIYCIVHDTTLGFGFPTLVASTVPVDQIAAVAIDSTRALIVYGNSGSTTQLNAAVISISGVTVTANTAVPTTLAAALGTITGLVAISGGFVVAYDRTGPFAALRAFTVSGTTPSAMSAETLVNSAIQSRGVFVSGTQGLALGYKNTVTATGYAQPFTLSGTTITLGTVATSTSWLSPILNIALGSAVVSFTANDAAHALITVSANVASISIFSATAQSAITNRTFFHYVASSTKLVFSGNSLYTLTNSSGTASISSPATLGAAFGFLYGDSGKLAAICPLVANGTNYQSGGWVVNTYDISGANPVASSIFNVDWGYAATASGQINSLEVKLPASRSYTTTPAAVRLSLSPTPSNMLYTSFGACLGGVSAGVFDGNSFAVKRIRSLTYSYSFNTVQDSVQLRPSMGALLRPDIGYFVGDNDSLYCVEAAA